MHTLKIEAAAWLEDGSCVCDQCPGGDEHDQNEVHALLICQDHRVCELRKHFPFVYTFFKVFSAAVQRGAATALDSVQVSHCDYADDIALTSNTAECLQFQLNKFHNTHFKGLAQAQH